MTEPPDPTPSPADPAELPGVERTPDLARRLRAHYGTGIDPEISLDGPGSSSPPSRSAPSAAPHAARYVVAGELARGGMGAILRVWDQELRRNLAMKVMLGDAQRTSADPVLRKKLSRFLEEAQITAQLDHPGVVPVHELGVDSAGRVYFAMKLVKGRSLREVFELVNAQQDGWNETRALGVILKVCEAMAYAHAKGVIHRDLKPANIMVGGFGEVFVMDWGLARVLGQKDRHDLRLDATTTTSELSTGRREERDETPDSPLFTMDGDVVGTPAYMPPEQARGEVERLSPRSDVYAIGAILYQLLARRLPFVPAGVRWSSRTVLLRLLEGPPAPLHTLRPDLPAELVAIVERAMARAPEERYGSTGELAEDLRAFLEHRVVKAYQTGALAELSKWVERNRWLAAACAAAVVALVAGLATSARLYVRAEDSARSALVEKERADREAEVATHRADEVLQLRALQTLDDLVVEAGTLWPAVPGNEARFIDWLERARDLADQLPGHDRQRQVLEARARPPTAAERLELSRNDSRASELRMARAWTLLELGEYDAALAEGERALEESTALHRASVQARRLALEEEVQRRVQTDVAPSGDATLALRAECMAAEIDGLHERVFDEDGDRWWHGQLARLVAGLTAFADPEQGLLGRGISPEHGWGIERRLSFGRDLRARSLDAPGAVERWRAALASIADPGESPAYGGLVMEPQMGLLPLGKDPRSGLWEFAHLTTGEPAERGADGRLALREETGLVLVLLPGGTCWIGAQNLSRTGLHFDPVANLGEQPVHEVDLSPFFVSKYEMTQGQWARFRAHNPSLDDPDSYNRDWNAARERGSLLHPVEQVDWWQCNETLQRLGLVLPSETQWEYAARAGSTTPWFSGSEAQSLSGAANLADRYAERHGGEGWHSIQTWLDDGNTTHAPVGRFAPNAFGLHDVHGNVWEWCRDVYGDASYARSTRRDPVAEGDSSAPHVTRGGCFDNDASFARSSMRNYSAPDSKANGLGVRPAAILSGRYRFSAR